MKPNNPFSIVGYQGPEYFCDREKETKKLLSWIEGEGLHTSAQVEAVVADLIEDRSLTFRDLLDSQNEVAKKLLPAIAKAGVVAEPNSAEFLSACALSGSSVRSSLADMRERDLVYKTDSGYVVYDRLLGEWLKTRS